MDCEVPGNKEQFEMTSRKEIKPVRPGLVEPFVPETGEPEIIEREPVGRIVHDDRGNAVRKWGGDTSATGTASGILKHIDPNDLKVQGASETREPDAGGGYDPYNQVQPRKKMVLPKKGSPGKR